MLLLIAGNETTTNLLGNFLNVLADRPQSWQQLRAQPKLIEQGIEETLGLMSRAISTAHADLAVHISWRSIKLAMWFTSSWGQRTETSRYWNANQFDLGEKIQHHTFGFGIHVLCLLARLEAKAAMQALPSGSLALVGAMAITNGSPLTCSEGFIISR